MICVGAIVGFIIGASVGYVLLAVFTRASDTDDEEEERRWK